MRPALQKPERGAEKTAVSADSDPSGRHLVTIWDIRLHFVILDLI
jgi:hypothetical protein